ncbi:MAG TPA: corrinoid protein [Dehalococcoidales bacterium]|nr:corrinoid protein [Dehalococcoidales bacterium]
MLGKATFERLYNAIIAGDRNEVEQGVGDALKEGIMPSDIIEKGMSPGMKEVGDRFSRYEIYLPEMMMAAEAWESAMRILEPKLLESGGERKKVGRVVLGTVKGDVHSIGKNIVGAMLKMNGFDVFDLGVDVAASAFVTKAEEVGADIIAASALMSTTIPQQKSIIEHLEARGARGKYRVLVGGGSTTQEWADSIGADGYGRTAGDAATLALKALAKK